jgi:pyruvate/2-oxoglutarate dehydrogenase complex dihydrolipoamide dehydrogenase (E3) component
MDIDVIVIGSGQAGVPLAVRLAEAGKRVLIAESGRLGGTCVNYGCTPTKTMVASARAAHVARTAGRLGVQVPEVQVDLSAVVERKEEIVGQWRAGVQNRLEQAGDRLTLVRGHARFVGEREIEVNAERHRAEMVIINTGARPREPAIDGLDDVESLNNETIMQLRDLPSHLLVLGGGYVGCEFGQMFNRFGSTVTIVQRSEHLLPREDNDISGTIEEVFREAGIEVRLGTEAVAVRQNKNEIELELGDGSALRCSHLLVATGRVSNTRALNLEEAGVATDDGGAIVVDRHYRTTAEGVYAVGDVTGGPQFTHTSWDDHRRLFDILMGRGGRSREDRLVPYTVFTDPQLGRVGLSEREAQERGVRYELASMPFGKIARATEIDERAGTMKVLLDPESERVLGAAIVGAEAGELIHIFVTLMQAEASARAIVEAQFVHPTLAEGVQSLVMSLDRFSL